MAKYNIGGYIFNDEESAKKAAKELKSVEYILGQLKEVDEKTVLAIYNKLLKQKPFSTDIGMGFLNQLRQNLLATGDFSEDEVAQVYSVGEPEILKEKAETIQPPAEEKEEITVKEQPKKEKVVKEVKHKEKVVKEVKHKEKVKKSESSPLNYEIRKLKIINSILIVFSVTLLLCIVGMFYVNSTINSPTILNYQESITDEYSQWKQELEQKEKELKEREKALEEREAGQ